MGATARDYLADDFDMQADDASRENVDGYRSFANYLRALSTDDERMVELDELLQPLLADDPRVGGTLYPDGDAIRFMDSFVPSKDPEVCEEYLDEFLGHLGTDYRRWFAHVAERGAYASWTLETGRPAVSACLVHFQTTPTSTPPQYVTWEQYLEITAPSERRAMCATRTRKANAQRLMSDAPEQRVTADDIWKIVEAAMGRCIHCGSLCLEKLPHDPISPRRSCPGDTLADGSGALSTSCRASAAERTILETSPGVASGAIRGHAKDAQELPTTAVFSAPDTETPSGISVCVRSYGGGW